VSARGKAKRLRVLEAGGAIHVPSVPSHIVAQYGSGRKWKALKRQELRNAADAIGALRTGCAFFPRSHATRYDPMLDQIQVGLARLRVLLSRKVWGQ